MISHDGEATISMSLIKTDIQIKNKNNLKWKNKEAENHKKYNNKTKPARTS